MSILVLLLLCFPFQEDAEAVRLEVDRLVEQLGSSDLEARDAAERALAKLGPKARKAVEAHRKHEDAEVRARVVRLLASTAFIAIPDELRPAVLKLKSDKLKEVRESVVTLLKVERKKLTDVLRKCVEGDQGILRFRVRQLLQLLKPASKPPLSYGILLLKDEIGVKDPLPGLEIWINVSDKKLILKNVDGIPDRRRLDKETNTIMGGAMAWSRRSGYRTFSLESGAARVDACPDLTKRKYSGSTGHVWGKAEKGARFSIRRSYTSDSVEIRKGEPKPWSGTRSGNLVEYRYRK